MIGGIGGCCLSHHGASLKMHASGGAGLRDDRHAREPGFITGRREAGSSRLPCPRQAQHLDSSGSRPSVTEERLPAGVHAKTALILRPRAVAPQGWDEADRKIRREGCVVRTGFSGRARCVPQEGRQGGLTGTVWNGMASSPVYCLILSTGRWSHDATKDLANEPRLSSSRCCLEPATAWVGELCCRFAHRYPQHARHHSSPQPYCVHPIDDCWDHKDGTDKHSPTSPPDRRRRSRSQPV